MRLREGYINKPKKKSITVPDNRPGPRRLNNDLLFKEHRKVTHHRPQ